LHEPRGHRRHDGQHGRVEQGRLPVIEVQPAPSASSCGHAAHNNLSCAVAKNEEERAMKRRLALALRWGLAGGAVLGLATAKNVVVGLLIQPVPWHIVIGLPPALFGIGVVCGFVGGLLGGLSDLLGWIGDAIIGATMGGCSLPPATCSAPALWRSRLAWRYSAL